MGKYWVEFIHGRTHGVVGQSMCGATARHVAAEVREKYRDVTITAIKALGDGTSASYRRLPWQRSQK